MSQSRGDVALALEMVKDGSTTRAAAEFAGTRKWLPAMKWLSKKHKIGTPVEFNGKLYYKTERGYWRCKDGKKGKTYLHRDVWIAAHGPVPDGYHVHHKDHDPTNWQLDNLELIEAKAHNSYHGSRQGSKP